ncbi:hypothetical protein [Gloeobacter kilaueensis]|uniref:Translation initiation factor n=1 Tax=Gloeobacter kilaueensis (strain ATCC BAA-2537 / CCAP 1431/1 / ULC 316 / JS1) TaxID=1183438 RepID=U5QJE8_GLOK1|nr:hypothetical protein [Gloeobacter kilaueensis]AGY58993.1 translation initiation factor [Gloeobacter kilaueensis JS1]
MPNFFESILDLQQVVYGLRQTMFGGTFNKSHRPDKGATAIVEGVASRARPGFKPPPLPKRPGMAAAAPPQVSAPQRPGAPVRPNPPQAGAPARPNPPQAGARPNPNAPVAPQAGAPQRPGMPQRPAGPPRPMEAPSGAKIFGKSMNDLPQIPGIGARPAGKRSAAEERAAQEMQLLQARGMNWFSAALNQWVTVAYSSARSFFERRQ